MSFFYNFIQRLFPKDKKKQENKSTKNNEPDPECVALGVLLQVVAESDRSFLPREKKTIKDILNQHYDFTQEQLNLVLRTIDEASRQRIDLYSFTTKFSRSLEYPKRVQIIKLLFRVAYADRVLAKEERETIRRIAGLLYVDHSDFINAKLEIQQGRKKNY